MQDTNNIFDGLASQETSGDSFEDLLKSSESEFANVNTTNTATTSTNIEGADEFKIGNEVYQFSRLQLDGINRQPVRSYASAKELLAGLTPEDKKLRKESSRAFKWIGTLVDKIDPQTKQTQRYGTVRYLKNVHFLRWIVQIAQSDDDKVYMTQDELLTYFANKCDTDSFIFGDPTTDTALKLEYSHKKSKDPASFDGKPQFTIVPAKEGMKKFDESKVVAAKEPVIENGKVKKHLIVKIDKLPDGITDKKDLDDENPAHAKYFYTVYKVKDEYKSLLKTKRERTSQKQQELHDVGATMLQVFYGN